MQSDENAFWTRSKKRIEGTSPLQEVLHDFATRFDPYLTATRTRSTQREKEIHAFAAANDWLATILDPGFRVTFSEIDFYAGTHKVLQPITAGCDSR
ncbi:MAG: hypothetical protein DMF32_12200, partial [Verrucomicrobia bacterium]